MGGILIDNYGFQATAFCFTGLFCLTLILDFKEFWSHVLVLKRENGKIVD